MMSTPDRGSVRVNFTPYPEQREVLESNKRFRVVAAGRRSGKTIMAAFATVRRALEAGSGWRGYWVGAEHQHAKTAYRLIDAVLPEEVVTRRNQSPPRTIELVDDRTIEFHTAGGGALVSVGLDWVVCDEAGKDFPERAWTQELRPALSDRDGEAMFISTPDGRGWFYEAYQRGQMPEVDDWVSWRWSSYKNPHVDDEEIDAAKDEVPDRIFRQEYLAEFVDETGGVFEGLDDYLFTGDYEIPISPDVEWVIGPYSTGVDLARHQDYRVIVTLDKHGHVVYFDRAQGETWPQIQREVEDVADQYPGVVAVDASRDNKLVADLEATGIPIEPVKFSAQRKRDLIENLIAAIEGEELTAPEIPELRTELEVFEYDVTRGGNLSYDAPEGFHDDTVDALALAVEARPLAAKQEVSATASVGEERKDVRGTNNLNEVAKEISRSRRNKWK